MSTYPRRPAEQSTHAADANPSATIYYLAQYQPRREPAALHFSITVDEALTPALQDIVMNACSDSVKSFKVEALPLKRQSRVWIQIKETAFNVAMHAIVFGLPCAELGPITHVRAS